MNSIQILKEEVIRKVLGDVEINTIIKKMHGKKLKQTERNYLYRSIRPKLIACSILSQENILKEINKPRKILNINQIHFNLDKYGYNLITSYKIKKQKTIAIEDLITKILTQIPEARLVEAIPIILIRNKINPYRLLEDGAKYDIKNQIGYLLETSFIIAKKFNLYKRINYLKGLLNYLKNTKDKEIKILGEVKDKEYIEFLEKTSPKRIKGWNLLGRYFDTDFIKIAKLYLR